MTVLIFSSKSYYIYHLSYVCELTFTHDKQSKAYADGNAIRYLDIIRQINISFKSTRANLMGALEE